MATQPDILAELNGSRFTPVIEAWRDAMAPLTGRVASFPTVSDEQRLGNFTWFYDIMRDPLERYFLGRPEPERKRLKIVAVEMISNIGKCIKVLGKEAMPYRFSIETEDRIMVMRSENFAPAADAMRLEKRLEFLSGKSVGEIRRLHWEAADSFCKQNGGGGFGGSALAPEDGRPHNGFGSGLLRLAMHAEHIRYKITPPARSGAPAHVALEARFQL